MIKTLIQPYAQGIKSMDGCLSARIHVGSVSGMLMNVGAFYKRFAPAASLIHAAYTKALVNEQIQDYYKLPEMFIESSILSALHMYFIMHVFDNVVKREEDSGSENAAQLRKALEYLAATEHERWYNERCLAGCVFSNEPYRLYNSNARLVHWDELSPQQKEDNLRYVISAMISQREKEMNAHDTYDDMITTYTL